MSEQKTLFISSRDRRQVSASSSDYITRLDEPFKVNSGLIQLLDARIDITTYNITATNFRLVFAYTIGAGGENAYTAPITPGFYTATEFVIALNAAFIVALAAIPPASVTASYNSKNGKFTFVATAGDVIRMILMSIGIPGYTDTLDGNLYGFRLSNGLMDPTPSLVYGPIVAANSITSDFIVEMFQEDAYYVTITFNYAASREASTSRSPRQVCSLIIPISGNFGDTAVLDLSGREYVLACPRDIRSVSIRIADKNGISSVLNNGNSQFTFREVSNQNVQEVI